MASATESLAELVCSQTNGADLRWFIATNAEAIGFLPWVDELGPSGRISLTARRYAVCTKAATILSDGPLAI